MTDDEKRPWRDRIWFYKPGSWCPGWRIVQWRGGDEYDWHTLVVGSRLTGAVVIARHPCRGTGRCADLIYRQVARMVTPNMGPVVVPDELSPDDGTRHYSVRSHEVPVKVVPDLPGLGDAPYNHDWSRVIRIREDGDQQVLLHETLHAILDKMLTSSPFLLGVTHGSLGHELINQIEVGLWESGWRRTGGESRG